MSEPPFNFQTQTPQKYDLMNGPSDNRSGVLDNKPMSAYTNALFQQQKLTNVPLPASINSNGMSTPSRDSSPLPPQMKQNNNFNTPNPLIQPPSSNLASHTFSLGQVPGSNFKFVPSTQPLRHEQTESKNYPYHPPSNNFAPIPNPSFSMKPPANTIPPSSTGDFKPPTQNVSINSNGISTSSSLHSSRGSSPLLLQMKQNSNLKPSNPPNQPSSTLVSNSFPQEQAPGTNFKLAPHPQPSSKEQPDSKYNPPTNSFAPIANPAFSIKPTGNIFPPTNAGDRKPPTQNLPINKENKFPPSSGGMPQLPNPLPQFQNAMPPPLVQPQAYGGYNKQPQPQFPQQIQFQPSPPNIPTNKESKNQFQQPPQNQFQQSLQNQFQPPPQQNQLQPPLQQNQFQPPPQNIPFNKENKYPPPSGGMPPLPNPMPPFNAMPPPPVQSQSYGGYNQQLQQQFSQQKQFQQPPPNQFQLPQQNQFQQPQPNQLQQQQQHNLNQQFNNLNVTQTGFNRLWGGENIDLLICRNVLPFQKVEAPPIHLQPAELNEANCSPDIFRCTINRIPDTSSLLNKSRLPLGVLIHPFRDLNHLPVIQCSTIVRCRACRTYINPFVYFVDQKRWKCNLCYRVNELPEEFQFDPVSKSYGDPCRRPEVKASTIEYIAPSEYMIRPPQPAVYLFLLDVSSLAIESGYLRILCDTLIQTLDVLPGDSRTQIGFLCYNSALHFYSLADGLSQPHEMTVIDIDDVFLPSPDNLLVNLKERKELVKDLLHQLPSRFLKSHDNGSALGAALQAAFKMMTSTGGRVSVFQCTLPTLGPGSLASREVPSNRASDDVQHLNPATDFYKRLALECSGHQIAVDLFILNSQYIDLSTISGISRFSAGCIHHWPLFKATRLVEAQQFENCLRRYLTRKIGYEAVMRIRCTRGLAIHTFHGNFFVRSTDLLTLPNCNPDSGFGMQVSIEESLSDLQTVCFQAALLYTSSKGERRIRVHTLCLPIAHTLQEVLNSADQQCIVGLVAKMAVDRSLQSNLADARDAFINVVVDVLSAFKLSLNQGSVTSTLLAPESLKLLPLYIVALLKHIAFRTGTSTRLDDRVYAMCQMKSLPLTNLIQDIYPDLYPIHMLTDENGLQTESGRIVPQPPRLQLSAEKLDSRGAFLLDCNNYIYIYVGHLVTSEFLKNTLGFEHFSAIPDDCLELPKIDTTENDRLHIFITTLNDNKPYPATIQIIRDNSPIKRVFLDKLIEDRIETALSYYEFLQHLKTHVK